MSNANWAFGSTLTRGGQAIAEITNIGAIQPRMDTAEVTSHDSSGGWEEFVGTIKRSGELQISGNFYPGDTNGQMGLWSDFTNKTIQAFVITLPAAMACTVSFSGLVVAPPSIAAPMDGAVPFEATIKISGPITVGVTASTGCSALAGIEQNTAAALDLVPNFGAAVYQYNVAVNTASTWVKFTVTAAGHSITIHNSFDDLTSSQTTAVESGALSLGAANTLTTFTIKVWQTGKVAKSYIVRVARA